MRIAIFAVSFALIAAAAGAVGPDDIKWNKSVSMVERITGKGPGEVIPSEYDDYGVKISGKRECLQATDFLKDGKKLLGMSN